MDTYFAPAERTDRRTFANQIEGISNSPIMSTLLEASGGLLIILNEDRQIVGLNEAFLASLGISDPAGILGLRLGEALNCAHALELPHGCGTTPHCATCGAAIAMMTAIIEDKALDQTCALTAEINGATHERYLSVRAQPLKVEGNRWILVFAQDITRQHSQTTLEQIFYHDLNNLLTAISCNSQILAQKMPDQGNAQQIRKAVERLTTEVSLQRFLSNQKDDAMLFKKELVSVRDIETELLLMVQEHPNCGGRNLVQRWPDEALFLTTDINLISRVLVNMVLNALEATPEGGTVRLNAFLEGDSIFWDVWNDRYIPPEVQLRIFQKHFSTKETMGRGIGTHAMKLIGERYLNGKISFTSSEREGTTFRFEHPLSCP